MTCKLVPFKQQKLKQKLSSLNYYVDTEIRKKTDLMITTVIIFVKMYKILIREGELLFLLKLLDFSQKNS